MTARGDEAHRAVRTNVATACMISSQHASPPPRSETHWYHPLRGVITMTGGSSGLLPRTVATMLVAEALVLAASATTRTSVPACTRPVSHSFAVDET